MRGGNQMPQKDWAYFNPVRIFAGGGSLARIAEFVPPEGKVLLVTTQGFVRRGAVSDVVDLLGAARVKVFSEVTPNPDLDDLDRATASLAGQALGAIVGLGGGSVLDAAKALSVTLPCGLSQPLQGIFRNGVDYQWGTSLPVVAIPTTAGTGSEVTPFATVWDGANHLKHSIAGPHVYPRVALLDPELTLTLPAEETLYTALDSVSHSLESLWNKNRTPVSQAFAVQALSMGLEALPRVIADPADLEARAWMQQASMLAGLAISQTRTAIAHSISYPLTSHYGVPHGLACSFTLENVIAVYLAQQPQHPLRALLKDVDAMLRQLKLSERIARYVSLSQISSLKGEMFTPSRADNFEGSLSDLDSILGISR